MKLTKAAKKEHFPCDICQEKILVGESYYRTVRQATSEEVKNPMIQKWRFGGGPPAVTIKIHKLCVDNRQAFRRFLQQLLPVRARARQ